MSGGVPKGTRQTRGSRKEQLGCSKKGKIGGTLKDEEKDEAPRNEYVRSHLE